MNKLIRLSSIFFIILTTMSCSQTTENKNPEEDKIIEMLKTFYKSYIIENSKNSINTSEIESIKTKYCTTALLEKIKKEELDADPFMNVQDFSKDWVNSLTVNKDPNLNDNSYKVCFEVTKEDSRCINVTVVNENKTWKVNNVSW